MKLTTIQVHMDTKQELEKRKKHGWESYEEVLKRLLEHEEVPSMKEMFQQGDTLKEMKRCSTSNVVKVSHVWRRS